MVGKKSLANFFEVFRKLEWYVAAIICCWYVPFNLVKSYSEILNYCVLLLGVSAIQKSIKTLNNLSWN